MASSLSLARCRPNDSATCRRAPVDSQRTVPALAERSMSVPRTTPPLAFDDISSQAFRRPHRNPPRRQVTDPFARPLGPTRDSSRSAREYPRTDTPKLRNADEPRRRRAKRKENPFAGSRAGSVKTRSASDAARNPFEGSRSERVVPNGRTVTTPIRSTSPRTECIRRSTADVIK